jgi:hypothetical protein
LLTRAGKRTAQNEAAPTRKLGYLAGELARSENAQNRFNTVRHADDLDTTGQDDKNAVVSGFLIEEDIALVYMARFTSRLLKKPSADRNLTHRGGCQMITSSSAIACRASNREVFSAMLTSQVPERVFQQPARGSELSDLGISELWEP